MTQLSVTPPAAAGAAQAPVESAPPALAQAAQRAEFSARLLAALAALRGGPPPAPAGAPAPLAADVPDLSTEESAAPLEAASLEEIPEESAPEDDGDAATRAAADVSAGFTPLVLLQIASDDAPEEPSGGEGAPAVADAGGEPTTERPASAPTPRSASFAPLDEIQPQPRADAQQPLRAAPQASEQEDAASEIDAATASAAPSRRGEKGATSIAPTPQEPAAPDPTLARGPEFAAPATPGARSEAPTPAAGRILPELPVRNEQEIVDQVRFLLNRKGGQASIELHPPQLGQLGLRISVNEHAVRLEITADRLPVAELLQKHLPALQHALEAQGLQIDRAQVDLRERSADGRERGGDPGDAEPRRGGRDLDGEGSQRNPGYSRSALPAYSLGAVDVHA